jgi:hypothetical protein
MSAALPRWLLALVASFSLPGAGPAAAALNRPADPVILTGADLPTLAGEAPGDIVAFRYESGWVQIPVQVDERAVVLYQDIYNNLQPSPFANLVYTDPDTFTGPDPDATLDADDEVVFMAADAGDSAPFVQEPPGVIPGSGVEVEISDPLDASLGYAYLFVRSSGLDPGAGQSYVDYQFVLLSGDYKTTYSIANGPNPENSSVTTSSYSLHISDRWILDEIRVLGGVATGVDILDRHKRAFAPGACQRTEDTFAGGEGAFIVNRNGPVRGIRSLLGANSGPVTQETSIYYAARHDVTTDLRVHQIQGVVDFMDYSPAASGLIYRNSLNPAGVPVDGVPDVVTPGLPDWELVDGPQGALIQIGEFSTDIVGLTITSYYEDDATPSTTQCTGDTSAYGSSGPWVTSLIPNTDPHMEPFNLFAGTRVIYYEAPGATIQDAEQRRDFVVNPLETSVAPFSGAPVPALGPRGALLLAALLLACSAGHARRATRRSFPGPPDA